MPTPSHLIIPVSVPQADDLRGQVAALEGALAGRGQRLEAAQAAADMAVEQVGKK